MKRLSPAHLAIMLVAASGGFSGAQPIDNRFTARDPHWLRSRKIRRPTKNWRYYAKRVAARRRNAGR